jgi:hypothetical protein
VDTNTECIDSKFPGLTDQEKGEIGGVLNPPKRQSAKDKTFALEIENNHLREKNSKGRIRGTIRKSRKILTLARKSLCEFSSKRRSIGGHHQIPKAEKNG